MINAVPISAPGVATLPPECFPRVLGSADISLPHSLWNVGVTPLQATDLYYNLHRVKISGLINYYCGSINYCVGAYYQQHAAATFWSAGEVEPPTPAIYDTYGTTYDSLSGTGNPFPYDPIYYGNVISAARTQVGSFNLEKESVTDWASGPIRIYVPFSPWNPPYSFNLSPAEGFSATLNAESRSVRADLKPLSWILNANNTIWPSLALSIVTPELTALIFQNTPAYFNISGWSKVQYSYGAHAGQYCWLPNYSFHHLGSSNTTSQGWISADIQPCGTEKVGPDGTQFFNLPFQWHGNVPFSLAVPVRVLFRSNTTALPNSGYGGLFSTPITLSELRLDLYPADE